MMRKTVGKLCFYLIISILAFLIITPFLWMISTSFKAREAIITIPIRWIPEEPSVSAYREIFQLANIDFGRGLINSFYLSFLLTVIPLLTAAMAGFVFAKIEFKGREFIFHLFLATMMIPGAVTMIPNYVILRTFHLLNTYTALILPSLGGAFAIFLIRQNMMGVDNAYLEAAIMDGASLYRIFLQVMLPLSKPVLFTMGLFNFVGAWNNFLWPLIVLSDRKKWTLQLGLANLGRQFGNFQHYQMAGALISIVPIIVMYMLTQKYVDRGLSIGGLKG